jgi:hypothetical protein
MFLLIPQYMAELVIGGVRSSTASLDLLYCSYGIDRSVRLAVLTSETTELEIYRLLKIHDSVGLTGGHVTE